MSEYRADATEVFGLLQQYLAIHKRIFKSSLKELGSAFGVSAPTPYRELAADLEGIIAALRKIRQRLSPNKTGADGGAASLRLYIDALVDTVTALNGVVTRLADNMAGMQKYSRREYRAEVKAYNELVRAYTALGWKLNEHFPNISGKNDY